MLLLTLNKTPYNQKKKKKIRPISTDTIPMWLTYKISILQTTENKNAETVIIYKCHSWPSLLGSRISGQKGVQQTSSRRCPGVFCRAISYSRRMLFLKRTKHKLQLFHTSNEPALPTVNKAELKNLLAGTITKLELEAKRLYGFKICKSMWKYM